MNFSRGYCPNAEEYFRSAISIPIYAGLSYENQTKVIKPFLKNVINRIQKKTYKTW